MEANEDMMRVEALDAKSRNAEDGTNGGIGKRFVMS